MFKYIRILLTAGWSVLHNFIWYIWRWAKHPEKTPLEVRYKRIRRLIIKVTNAFHIDWKKEGMEHLRSLERQDKRFLLVANHMSMFDPLACIYWSEKPITFVAKKEAEKFPFIGAAMKALDGQFLDRDNLRQGVQVIKKIEEYISTGYCSVVIYPEGTRNRNPEGPLPPFHPGTFKPAFRVNCPILPLAIYGTHRPFSTKIQWKRFPVEFVYQAPIDSSSFAADETTTTLADRIHDAVEADLIREREMDADFLKKGYEKVPLKKGLLR